MKRLWWYFRFVAREQDVASFESIVAVILPADDELEIVARTTNGVLGVLVTQLVDFHIVDTKKSISYSQTGLFCQTVAVDLNQEEIKNKTQKK